MTTALVAVSNGDEEDTSCPVCYESFPPAVSCEHAVCTVCKHAVCRECDTMLKQAGHVRCPLCRAPRALDPTLPLHMVIHAFHCIDAACERPRCTEAKLLLVKIEVHVQNCLHTSDACTVCELWRTLNASLTVHAPSAATAVSVSHQPPAPLLPSLSQARVLPPAQVKRMLLAHVRKCRSPQCNSCFKMRQRMHLYMHIRKRKLLPSGGRDGGIWVV